MPKIDLTDLASLTNEQSALSSINANYATIETESDNFLSRDGTSPNQMEADLDMNSNRILNLPEPLNSHEPARLADIGNALIYYEAAVDAAEEAEGYADSAETSATNAQQSATNAQSAEIERSGGRWSFDETTTMDAPLTGFMRLNNATLSSVTEAAFHAQSADSGNPDMSDYLATWADSSNTVKGQLILRKAGTPSSYAIYDVSGVTDNTTWIEVGISHVSSNGSFAASDRITVGFARAGDKGSDGVGTGDMSTVTYDPNEDGIIAVAQGGTGASTASGARTNLGVGTVGTLSSVATANIDDDAVTNAKLANMAASTFKGRVTASTGSPEDLTATEATSLLDEMVGDSGSGGTKGLVPAPAAGDAAANKFLKADGTWAAGAGVSFATDSEAITGTSTVLAITPANLSAVTAARTNRGCDLLCPHEALVISKASNSTVDVDATAVLLFDTNGRAKRFTSLNVTVNIASSGAAGLDTGSEANSTWYTIYAVGKEDGTVSAVLSTNTTSPTLPTDYIYWGKVGLVRNNASGNFVAFFQRGNKVSCQIESEALSAGNQTSYTSVDLSTFVPPIAKAALLRCNLYTSSGTANGVAEISPAGSVTTATYGKCVIRGQSLTNTWGMTDMAEVFMSTPQTIVYFISGTNVVLDIGVSGYIY